MFFFPIFWPGCGAAAAGSQTELSVIFAAGSSMDLLTSVTKGGEGDTALFLNWWRTLISVVGFWVISVMRHFESGWGIELPVCCHEASLSAKELQQLRWSTERLLYGSLGGLFVAAKSARSVWVLVFVIRNPRLVNPLKIILSTPDNWQLLDLSYLCSDPCGTGCIWLK